MKRILAIVCLLAASAFAQEWAWPVLARQASQRQGAGGIAPLGPMPTNYPGIVHLMRYESNWVCSVSERTFTAFNSPTFTTGKYGSSFLNVNGAKAVYIRGWGQAHSNAFTVSTWVWIDSVNGLNGYNQLLILSDEPTHRWRFHFGNSATTGTQRVRSMGWQWVTQPQRGSSAEDSVTTAMTGKWNHVAWVINPPNLTMYLNGEVMPADPASPGTNLAVAATSYGDWYWGGVGSAGLIGRLDDSAIINRALSADEIKAIAGGD